MNHENPTGIFKALLLDGSWANVHATTESDFREWVKNSNNYPLRTEDGCLKVFSTKTGKVIYMFQPIN